MGPQVRRAGGRGAGRREGRNLCRCSATSRSVLPSRRHTTRPRLADARGQRQKEEPVLAAWGGASGGASSGQEERQTHNAKRRAWRRGPESRSPPPVALLLPPTGPEHRGSNSPPGPPFCVPRPWLKTFREGREKLPSFLPKSQGPSSTRPGSRSLVSMRLVKLALTISQKRLSMSRTEPARCSSKP